MRGDLNCCGAGNARATGRTVDDKRRELFVADVDTQDGVNPQALRMVGTMFRFVRSVDQRLRRKGLSELSLTESAVLLQIERGTSTPSEISDTMHIDRPRVTRIVDRLVALGYVTREADQIDRRRTILSITPVGERRLNAILALVSSLLDELLVGLERQQRETLMAAVEFLRPVAEGRTGLSAEEATENPLRTA
jgi:DNA-binding MarR family transcriptional regulator